MLKTSLSIWFAAEKNLKKTLITKISTSTNGAAKAQKAKTTHLLNQTLKALQKLYV